MGRLRLCAVYGGWGSGGRAGTATEQETEGLGRAKGRGGSGGHAQEAKRTGPVVGLIVLRGTKPEKRGWLAAPELGT